MLDEPPLIVRMRALFGFADAPIAPWDLSAGSRALGLSFVAPKPVTHASLMTSRISIDCIMRAQRSTITGVPTFARS